MEIIMKPKKDFEYGKQLVKRLLVMAIVFCLGSLLAVRGSYVQLGFMLLSVLCLIGELVVLFLYCCCPYCGKHILFGALAVTTCPRCHRNLTTGKKTKKSKR